jgi:hypothetical protein
MDVHVRRLSTIHFSTMDVHVRRLSTIHFSTMDVHVRRRVPLNDCSPHVHRARQAGFAGGASPVAPAYARPVLRWRLIRLWRTLATGRPRCNACRQGTLVWRVLDGRGRPSYRLSGTSPTWCDVPRAPWSKRCPRPGCGIHPGYDGHPCPSITRRSDTAWTSIVPNLFCPYTIPSPTTRPQYKPQPAPLQRLRPHLDTAFRAARQSPGKCVQRTSTAYRRVPAAR